MHLTACHRKPERSFFWKGKQFPVCARCTGIHFGYFAFPIFLFGFYSINIWVTLAMMSITYIDGIIQAFFNLESNNIRRVITGVISGVGSMSLVSITGIAIGKLILQYIN
ncbi:DUF2085 domain-containing protein [Frigoriflavimonas asaccharolytica]|uniref:DUF2085 domain-containing protein n=1 Tax=Frigoriflavimonas asaccharolytica TaxID=2735899 RepID=UPI00293BCC36|nr:DUF2085 domain-containing protein [Frigoriflavimonas asaccharolytica]